MNANESEIRKNNFWTYFAVLCGLNIKMAISNAN